MTTLTDQGPTSKGIIGRLGIIGGGQLGMYLCQAARELGITSSVFTPSQHGPAEHAADTTVVADLDNGSALAQLIELSDVITFELEAIPDDALRTLQEAVERYEVVVYPRPETLLLLKDKGAQKAWMVTQGLPTLPYLAATPGPEFSFSEQQQLSLPVVQKACRGGYDGKGVQMIQTVEDLSNLWPIESVFEPLLESRVEVAVIVARTADGELASYPTVSMEFDGRFNAVDTVTSPAEISAKLRDDCEALARSAVISLDGVGVFAVEFFIAEDNSIYINEISPRVHNSGHLTIEAFGASQFEQHVRAVMGLSLAQISSHVNAAVMRNILYDQSWEGCSPLRPNSIKISADFHTQVHWYGKTGSSDGRKMGHVTALGKTATDAAENAAQALFNLRAPESNQSTSANLVEEPTCR
ncbi:MAG: 5-(carboxyamino)imidazole ribonucleotide synthase [Alcanivorax sp.]|jgi:5-(carboxyamino)imidazole ribonucleotide synthase